MGKSSYKPENLASAKRGKLPAWSMLEKERVKFVFVERELPGADRDTGEQSAGSD